MFDLNRKSKRGWNFKHKMNLWVQIFLLLLCLLLLSSKHHLELMCLLLLLDEHLHHFTVLLLHLLSPLQVNLNPFY